MQNRRDHMTLVYVPGFAIKPSLGKVNGGAHNIIMKTIQSCVAIATVGLIHFQSMYAYAGAAKVPPSLKPGGLVKAAAKTADEAFDIKAVMYSFLGAMQGLKSYMVSYADFSNPENKEDVIQRLKDFSKLVETGKPLEVEASPGFSVTYDLMVKHLHEVEHLYSAGATESAWQRLNATGNFCLGCHSRLPREIQTRAFNWGRQGFGVEPLNGSYKDAEFLFLQHQYLPALEMMNRLVRTHEDKNNRKDLDAIFERKINYYARILRNPKLGIESLEQDLKNPHLPTLIQADIRTWIDGFKNLKVVLEKWPQKPSDMQLLTKAKEIVGAETSERRLALGDSQTIPTLWISGLLYERVFMGGNQPEMAEFLYLLAKAERHLQSLRIYSLADVYLKQCVELFPKQPIARKCYSDYSVSLKQKYRIVPEAIQNSIEALGKTLQQ